MSLLSDGRELVASGDLNLNNYRLMFRTIKGRDTDLNDNELIVAIQASEGEMSDAQWVDWIEGFESRELFNDIDDTGFETEEETEAATVEQHTDKETQKRDQLLVSAVTASANEALANDEARKITAETLHLMADTTEAKEKVNVFPARLMERLVTDFGKDDIRRFPPPGSKFEKGSNKPFDRWATKVDNGSGGTRTVNMSFYGVMFDATANGIEINKQLEYIRMAKNGEAQKGADNAKPVVSVPKEYTAMSDTQLVKAAAKYNSRRTFQIGQLRKAIELFNQMERVNEMPLVGAYFDYDFTYENGKVKSKTVTNTPKPITVYAKTPSPDDPSKIEKTGQRATSINTFLRYKVDVALKNGGTRDDLIETVARDTNKAGPKSKDALPVIGNGNISVVWSYINNLNLWLRDPANLELFVKTINDPKLEDDKTLNLGDVAQTLESLATRNEKKYNVARTKVDLAEAEKAKALVKELKKSAA